MYKKKEIIIPSLITAILLSASLIAGRSLEQASDFSLITSSKLTTLKNFSLYTILSYIIFYTVYYCISRIHIKRSRDYFFPGFLILWLVIFLCWIPCYLAYYPGTFTYDVGWQTEQALGMVKYDNWHPVLHTYFLSICIKISKLIGGTDNTSLIIYSISQMLIVSALFASVLSYMQKIGVHIIIKVLSFAYFALFPFNAVLSFNVTKDVIFAGIFVLFTVFILDLTRSPGVFLNSKKTTIKFFFVALLLCLFRHNGIYIMILLFPCALILMWQYRKQISFAFLSPIFAFLIITNLLFPVLQISPGPVQEKLSVLMHQLALVARNHDNELSDEEKATIYRYIQEDAPKIYNPRWTESTKNLNGGFKSDAYVIDPHGFKDIWFTLLKRYPQDYIISFLTSHLSYWDPGVKFVDCYYLNKYILTHINDYDFFKIERKSVFPKLLVKYERATEIRDFDNILVRFLYSTATPIWVVFCSIMICLIKNNKRLILGLLPSFFLWLTIMASPAELVRLIYPLMISYPLYFTVIFQSNLFKTPS